MSTTPQWLFDPWDKLIILEESNGNLCMIPCPGQGDFDLFLQVKNNMTSWGK
jgi:hypothetical protein